MQLTLFFQPSLEALFLAIILDLVLGEPPSRLHPVVWIGRLIDSLVAKAPKENRKMFGLLIALFCIGIAILGGSIVLLIGLNIPGLVGLVLIAFFLKASFSVRMLFSTARGIQKKLELEEIEEARLDLKALVGRDTSKLSSPQASSAVIESVSENLVDSIFSPLFYYLLFGLPGALAYRTINTLDSMIGFSKEPYRDIGYASARIDDLANWIPARVSPVFIIIASIPLGCPLKCLKVCARDHSKTSSPNSGWPMAAISGALGCRLEKIGYHVLGREFSEPRPSQIKDAILIIGISTFLAFFAIFLLILMLA